VVVDLSSLWAGPLCGLLQVEAGHRVLKVESTRRPDGARRGPARFFRDLNAGKEPVLLDLPAPEACRELAAILAGADVVIEGSRPRALRQMGVDAVAWLAARPGRRWVSITAHGREGAAGERVGFGDDAAVAGGLVARDARGPVFLADAAADPLAGLAAAAALRAAEDDDRSLLLDVSMAAVAAEVAGGGRPGAPSRPAGASAGVSAGVLAGADRDERPSSGTIRLGTLGS
jgi:crotonobetainyl-CoA:carnitine CoA-transferase CaiB-like acyl-CoA transferase